MDCDSTYPGSIPVVPTNMNRYATVSACAPTWMDIKMRDFERSHYTNAPMFEPLVTDYYKKTWICYCEKVNFVGQDCREIYEMEMSKM